MFRYIDMPKLVAFYLREFSARSDGSPSNLYKFIFCLCLPFVSQTFRIARLRALAVAECTNSGDQIVRVLSYVTGADVRFISASNPYYESYDGTGMTADFTYGASPDEEPLMTYNLEGNDAYIQINPKGVPVSEIEAWLPLLIPFYVRVTIIYRYD